MKLFYIYIGGKTTTSLIELHDVRFTIGEKIEEKRVAEICETLRTLDAVDDIHAPASYRQQLATVLPRRALLKAHQRFIGAAA